MSWGDDLFDQAKGQHELARRVQNVIGLLQGAQDQPSFEDARPFLEQACDELDEMLHADEQRIEIMDIRSRAGVEDEEDPFGADPAMDQGIRKL